MITVLAVLVGLMLMPASLAFAGKPADQVQGGKSAAAKACVAEKKADKASFKETYGKHAMRNCIKGESEASDEGDDAAEAKNAAKECKAEQAADPVAFEEENGNGKNAFGKCVSSKVEDDDESDEDEDDEDVEEEDDEDEEEDDEDGE